MFRKHQRFVDLGVPFHSDDSDAPRQRVIEIQRESSGGLISLGKSLANFHNQTVALRIGNWVVTTYAFFNAAAFFFGCTISLWFNSMGGCDVGRLARLHLLITLPAILVGSRIFSICTEWKRLFHSPLETVLRPGYMYHGGLFGGLIALAAIAHLTHSHFLFYCDGVAIALPFAEAVGRLGCYVYGCCWGCPTTHGMGIRYTSPDSSVVRNAPELLGVKLHPVQLYFAAFAMLLFFSIQQLLPYRQFDGMLTAVYFAIHPLGRFALEKLRQDNRGKLWGRWTHTNLYSGLMLIGAFSIWWFRSSFGLTPLDTGIEWRSIVANPNVMCWVIPFSVIFFFTHGVQYKAVGSWLCSKTTSEEHLNKRVDLA